MTAIVLILVMLLAVVVSGFIVRVLPFSPPLPIVQIVLGGLISGVLNQGIALQPQLFFLLFLPPLLFLDGWRIPKDGLFRDWAAILQLALGLVIFTVIGAGYFIHWMMPTIPLAVAFALAAIVSPTDPVAVSAIASHSPVPKRLMHILEGESLLNDASGLVCFQFAVAAALTGSFSLASASLTFVWVALAGLALGVAFTLAVAFIAHGVSRRFGEEEGSPILISLLIPFGAYLLAEHMHASGILAAVAAGISMSYVERRGHSLARTRLQRDAVWDTLQFALNGLIFVLLGEQLPAIVQHAVATVQIDGLANAWWLALYAVIITAGLAFLRFAWVWVSLQLNLQRQRLAGKRTHKVDMRLVLATSLAGVRGAITLAGILTLPLVMADGSAFPARGLVIFLAAAVIILSLVVASVALPMLLKGLEVPREPADARQEDDARTLMACAAIEALKKAQTRILQDAEPADAEIYADAATRVIALYQHRAQANAPEASDAGQLRKADTAERRLRVAALQAERAEVLKQTRQRKLGEEISRKLVRELDLLESRYH